MFVCLLGMSVFVSVCECLFVSVCLFVCGAMFLCVGVAYQSINSVGQDCGAILQISICYSFSLSESKIHLFGLIFIILFYTSECP